MALSEGCFFPSVLIASHPAGFKSGRSVTAVIKRVIRRWGKKDETELFQQPERWSREFSHDTNGCSHVRARIPSSLQEPPGERAPPLLNRPYQDRTEAKTMCHPQYRGFFAAPQGRDPTLVFCVGGGFSPFPLISNERGGGGGCCASVFFIVQYCSALIALSFHSICSQCQQSLKCQTKCDNDDGRG